MSAAWWSAPEDRADAGTGTGPVVAGRRATAATSQQNGNCGVAAQPSKGRVFSRSSRRMQLLRLNLAGGAGTRRCGRRPFWEQQFGARAGADFVVRRRDSAVHLKIRPRLAVMVDHRFARFGRVLRRLDPCLQRRSRSASVQAGAPLCSQAVSTKRVRKLPSVRTEWCGQCAEPRAAWPVLVRKM